MQLCVSGLFCPSPIPLSLGGQVPDFYRPLCLRKYHTLAWSVWSPAAAAESLQSCLTLHDHIDGSPPGSPIPGILHARTLEWVAISFSSAWKWKWSRSVVSNSATDPIPTQRPTPWTAAYQAPPSMGFSRQEYWSGSPLPSPVWSPRQHLKVRKLSVSICGQGLLPGRPQSLGLGIKNYVKIFSHYYSLLFRLPYLRSNNATMHPICPIVQARGAVLWLLTTVCPPCASQHCVSTFHVQKQRSCVSPPPPCHHHCIWSCAMITVCGATGPSSEYSLLVRCWSGDSLRTLGLHCLMSAVV